MVFGWLGYLLARAFFSRRLKWIVVAVLLLVFFSTMLGGLLPTADSNVSWQSHVCGRGRRRRASPGCCTPARRRTGDRRAARP